MSRQHINIGTPNGQNGDFVRTSFDKTNDNFIELYARVHEIGQGYQDITNLLNGVKNTNGLYTWVKYAEDGIGTNMTDTATSLTTWIGLAYNKETPIESLNASDYTWSLITDTNIFWTDYLGVEHHTWIKYASSLVPPFGLSDSAVGMKYFGIGLDKTTAEPAPGALTEQQWFEALEWHQILEGNPIPGTNLFNWIKFADDDTGTNLSDYIENRTYVGFAYGKDTPNNSLTPSDYTFGLIDGDNINPDDDTYTWLKFAKTPHQSIQDSPFNSNYLGVKYGNVDGNESTLYTDYTWQLIPLNSVGEGLPITESLYTWIKYAPNGTPTDSEISDVPAGMTHIGIAINKNLPESTDPNSLRADFYVWSLIQGDQGYTGPDGKTYYVWVKYATSATGTGISDDPTGKTYIGIAYNKLLPEAEDTANSNNPANYEWSLIGADVVKQNWTYLWIKFANSNLRDDGTIDNFGDTAHNRSWMGIAYDKTSSIESEDPADYTWNPLLGEQGYTGIDGRTYYTWVKYAKSPTSSTLEDSPEGNFWMGLAFNKELSEADDVTNSSLYSNYTWFPIEIPIDENPILDQNNLVKVINIPTGALSAGVTVDSIAAYLNEIGVAVLETENLIITIGDVGLNLNLDASKALTLTYANITETTADIAWDINRDNALIKYEIFVSSSLGVSIIETTNKSYQLTGLTNNINYSVFIKAYDAFNSFKISNTIEFKTLTTYNDTVTPVLNLVSVDEDTINIAYSIDSSFAPDEYNIYIQGGLDDYVTNTLLDTVTETNYSIEGLENNTAYDIYVEAVRGVTVSSPSNVVTATTTLVLTAPVITPQSKDETSITFSINVPAIEPVTAFIIFYRILNGASAWTETQVSNSLIQTLANLTPDTGYEIKIKSKAGNILSDFSNTLSIFTESRNRVGVDLSTPNQPYLQFYGYSHLRYPTNTYTTPVFNVTPVKKGTAIRIFIEFSAKGSIAYTATYDKRFVATQDYPDIRAWYNAEVVTLGTWGDTWTRGYGFTGDGSQFYVRAHRDGTASRNIGTTVFFEVSNGGILEISNGQPSTAVTFLVEVIDDDPGVIAVFNTLGITVTKNFPRTVNIALDSNGKFKDTFTASTTTPFDIYSINPGQFITTIRVTLLSAAKGIDPQKALKEIQYNFI